MSETLEKEKQEKLAAVTKQFIDLLFSVEPEHHIQVFNEIKECTAKRVAEDIDRLNKQADQTACRAKELKGYWQEKLQP